METYQVIVFNPRENATTTLEITANHKDQISEIITRKIGKHEIVSIVPVETADQRSKKTEITCEGCLLGCMGQSDHMYPGGCLYESDDN